jgi:TPR repeat protein
LDYFHRSADLGYAPAQDMMGYFTLTGTLTPQEPGEAASWYRKAAQQGDRLGQWVLGSFYYLGTGVPRDLNQAEHWLRLAADQDDPFGQHLLGRLSQERGDYVAATGFFRKAANHGLPQAQKQLGLLLKEGRTGRVAMDKTDAYIWLLLAFQAGDQTVANDLQQLETDLGSNQTELAKTRARDRQSSLLRSVVARGCTGWPGDFSDIPTPPTPNLQKLCR